MMRVIGPLLALALALSSGALANDAPAPPKKNDPNAPPPKPPSSLTGNAIPHCDLGSYPAGNICKPAPPGFYAGPSATYPTACPPGTTSSYGARGRSECY